MRKARRWSHTILRRRTMVTFMRGFLILSGILDSSSAGSSSCTTSTGSSSLVTVGAWSAITSSTTRQKAFLQLTLHEGEQEKLSGPEIFPATEDLTPPRPGEGLT